MQIYTGNMYGSDLIRGEKLGLGIMIASSPSNFKPSKDWKGLPLALDNGAFQCYRRGYPFMENDFFDTLRECYRLQLELDFIVCPDIVGEGLTSLDFSLHYARTRLTGCKRLALAVQDGMLPRHIATRIADDDFSTIFVGGTLEWKWSTLPSWVSMAHENGMKCHVGRCGTTTDITKAIEFGVDSVDSTSIARNKSWQIIEGLHNNKSLFTNKPIMESTSTTGAGRDGQ